MLTDEERKGMDNRKDVEDLVLSFIESCPKEPLMTYEEIQAEVNAVRYGR